MKKSPILGVALLCVLSATAQPSNTVPKNIRATNTLDNLGDLNGLAKFDNLYGIPMEPGTITGTAYLEADWKRTTFLLYDAEKMIEGFHARYEIDHDQFEIRTSAGVKVLNGKNVKSFVWIDSLTGAPHYFVNGKDFPGEESVSLAGFFEVLSEGACTLLSKTEVAVRNPSYNEKFDMGRRDTRIVRKTSYYYFGNGLVRELPSGRKKLLPVFGGQAPAVGDFIKVNDLSTDEAGHLKAIFDHYNKLVITN